MPRRRSKRGQIGPFTHITRQPGAWSVGIIRKGRPFTRWFADAVWGGRLAALVEARYYRDDDLLQRIDADTRVRRRPPKGSHSSTGVPGVNREVYVVGGRTYVRFVAAWRDAQGHTRRRRFGVGRHGREQARRKAKAARKAGVAESRRERLARQREDAAMRLRDAPPRPRQVKEPLSRKGISMARRRPRRRPDA